MKRIISLGFIVVLTTLLISSCKSKQLVTEIQSAHEPAAPAPVNPEPSYVQEPQLEFPIQVEAEPVKEQEQVREESFKLASGETNRAALRKKYHVQVGAFRIHNNAKALRDKLEKEGNNPVLVENEQGMLRVIIASYDEYRPARDKIKQVQPTFPDAWILVQSKK